MKSLNVENIKKYINIKKAEYFKKVQAGEISYKKYNAFLNEFNFNLILDKIEYLIKCFNNAEKNNNYHYMKILKSEILSTLKLMKRKIQKWS